MLSNKDADSNQNHKQLPSAEVMEYPTDIDVVLPTISQQVIDISHIQRYKTKVASVSNADRLPESNFGAWSDNWTAFPTGWLMSIPTSVTT